MRSRVLAVLCAVALSLPLPALAQETEPGDPCATAGAFRATGGAENPDGHFVFCDGSVWQPILGYSSAGGWVMFGSAGLAAAPLHIEGEAIIRTSGLACSAAAYGAMRYASASDLWEYCDGSAWTALTSGGGGTPAGADREIQFNSGGAFGADANLVFSSAGYLGVGTPDPQALFDVAGEIRFSSSGLPCGPAQEGAVRYTGGNPPWEFCDGSAWSPFKQPRCQDDGTGECYLQATRSNDDPDFTAANIKCDVNVLGVTGILGTGTNPPDPFTNAFTDVTDQPVSTTVTSNIVQMTGVHCQSNVTVSGTGSPQFRICDDATCSTNPSYGTSGQIVSNQYLQLRLTTSSSYNNTRSATPDINGGTDTWSATTCDGVPDAYTFTDLTDQPLSTLVTSDIIQISGLTCSPTVTINSGASGSPRLRVCTDATCSTNPSFGTSGTISNGQYLQLRLTTSGSANTTRTGIPDIAGITDNWDVTTCDGTPDAYTFTDLTSQPLNTVVNSNIVQITGFTCSGVSVSVSGAATRKYRVCTDATCSTNPSFITSGGTINPGQYLQLQMQTSGSYTTASTVTPSIGGVTDNWSTTTTCDNDPAAYMFADISGQATSTLVQSNIVQITGMAASCPANVTISGDGSPQFRVCSDATCSTSPAFGTSGSISNNEYLQLQLTTSASNSTISTATPSIAGASGNAIDNWRAVTIGVGCDTTPVTHTTAGTQAFTVPANCNSITAEAFGAGGGGGTNNGGAGGGGGALLIRDADSKVINAGGGGGGGGGGTASAGGGGGYSKCTFITAGGGQNFTAYIGGGGNYSTGNSGVAGGAVSGGSGGGGGSTYGGGGGGNSSAFPAWPAGSGGNSTYGGGGGGGKGVFAADGTGGASTYGGAGGNGNNNPGQGGKTYLDAECTSTVATNGSNGSGSTGGAAANGGPGSGGNDGNAGGAGKIVITPAP